MDKELALKIADALQEKWSIGSSSRFCDDPPDWDEADREEIAEVIQKAADNSLTISQ